MSFLALLAGLALFRLWGTGGALQNDQWFIAWRGRAVALLGTGFAGLALAVVVPAWLVAWLLGRIDGVLFGLLWIAASVVVLLYALGRRDLEEIVARYRSYSAAGDFEGGWLALSPALGLSEDEQVANAAQAHAQILRSLAYTAYQRWFAVVFYFLLLGPAGALAYRLLQQCRDELSAGLAQRWLFYVDWLPGRVLAATFALTGDFVKSREALVQGIAEASTPIDLLLYQVAGAACARDGADPGDAAVQSESAVADVDALHSLLARSALSWVAVIAVWVLFD